MRSSGKSLRRERASFIPMAQIVLLGGEMAAINGNTLLRQERHAITKSDSPSCVWLIMMAQKV